MESYAHRFWRYENGYVTLFPVDEAEPRLGGKVRAKVFVMDWRTLTPSYKTLHGIYSDDFITFGEFSKEAGDPFHNEELLLKVVDEQDRTTVADRVTFRFENNSLLYKREVNQEVLDPEVEHQVKEAALQPIIDQTWTETFFYGLGNKKV
jgi:hypothetical protein